MNPIVCSICGEIGAYSEIDNPQTPSDDDESQGLPQAALALKPANADLERYYRYKSERLLKCPACGTYYWYRQWAPGGSEDVMRTYIHESLRRLSSSEVWALLTDTVEQAREKAQIDGGFYVDDFELARRGADAELALLKSRALDVRHAGSGAPGDQMESPAIGGVRCVLDGRQDSAEADARSASDRQIPAAALRGGVSEL